MWIIYKSRLFRLLKYLRLIPEKYIALTLFEWILTDRSHLLIKIKLHEQRHVWQYRWHLYVFFLPMYGLLALFYSYEKHPYEIDAVRYSERNL